ncbi:hypothetical protein GGR56DRAFT_302351 [Xylariaceae sp. FL0804]|nr:hypothetical protein GGR56DRAFT_302351 [Xylariaceae sp. FL0804]
MHSIMVHLFSQTSTASPTHLLATFEPSIQIFSLVTCVPGRTFILISILPIAYRLLLNSTTFGTGRIVFSCKCLRCSGASTFASLGRECAQQPSACAPQPLLPRCSLPCYRGSNSYLALPYLTYLTFTFLSLLPSNPPVPHGPPCRQAVLLLCLRFPNASLTSEPPA